MNLNEEKNEYLSLEERYHLWKPEGNFKWFIQQNEEEHEAHLLLDELDIPRFRVTVG